MLPLFDQGLLKPVIDRHFSIHEVVDAPNWVVGCFIPEALLS